MGCQLRTVTGGRALQDACFGAAIGLWRGTLNLLRLDRVTGKEHTSLGKRSKCRLNPRLSEERRPRQSVAGRISFNDPAVRMCLLAWICANTDLLCVAACVTNLGSSTTLVLCHGDQKRSVGTMRRRFIFHGGIKYHTIETSEGMTAARQSLSATMVALEPREW